MAIGATMMMGPLAGGAVGMTAGAFGAAFGAGGAAFVNGAAGANSHPKRNRADKRKGRMR